MSTKSEQLRQITDNSKALKKIEMDQRQEDEKSNQVEADTLLFQSIVSTIDNRLEEAARSGKDSVTIWEMGNFGHINSDEIVDGIPENWNVFRKVMDYCRELGLQTEQRTIMHPERFTTYISYSIEASW